MNIITYPIVNAWVQEITWTRQYYSKQMPLFKLWAHLLASNNWKWQLCLLLLPYWEKAHCRSDREANMWREATTVAWDFKVDLCLWTKSIFTTIRWVFMQALLSIASWACVDCTAGQEAQREISSLFNCICGGSPRRNISRSQIWIPSVYLFNVLWQACEGEGTQ